MRTGQYLGTRRIGGRCLNIVEVCCTWKDVVRTRYLAITKTMQDRCRWAKVSVMVADSGGFQVSWKLSRTDVARLLQTPAVGLTSEVGVDAQEYTSARVAGWLPVNVRPGTLAAPGRACP